MKNLSENLKTKLINSYVRSKQRSFNSSLTHCLETARSMLKKSRYCVLITNNDAHCPSARTVQPICDLDTFVIWMGTNPSLRKIKEIQKNPYVTLSFSNDKEDANLIVYGKAVIERDVKEKSKHWIGSWLMFFPNGPSADDFVSIRVEPIEMELMNFKRNVVPPEPFGLKPVRILKSAGGWQIQ